MTKQLSQADKLKAVMDAFRIKQEKLARCPMCSGARFGVSFGTSLATMNEITRATCTCRKPTAPEPEKGHG